MSEVESDSGPSSRFGAGFLADAEERGTSVLRAVVTAVRGIAAVGVAAAWLGFWLVVARLNYLNGHPVDAALVVALMVAPFGLLAWCGYENWESVGPSAGATAG